MIDDTIEKAERAVHDYQQSVDALFYRLERESKRHANLCFITGALFGAGGTALLIAVSELFR